MEEHIELFPEFSDLSGPLLKPMHLGSKGNLSLTSLISVKNVTLTMVVRMPENWYYAAGSDKWNEP